MRNWRKIKKERGSLKPIINYQKGHSHGIKDYQAFRDYVDANPDKTQEEMAQYFKVGSSTIGRALKKLHYSKKKSKTYSERNDKLRAAYVHEIKTLSSQERVYIDESGMNDSEKTYALVGRSIPKGNENEVLRTN